MIEIKGDLFEQTSADAICLTTNGYVNGRGENIMGRGCAGEAKRRWPGIQYAVGTVIQGFGNRPIVLTFEVDGQIYLQECKKPIFPRHNVPYHIVTFPTKPRKCSWDNMLPHYQTGNPRTGAFPGWMAHSSIVLIQDSADQLVKMADTLGWKQVVLPRPGCGAGELNWGDVRKVLEPILDDRFAVITFK